MCSNDNLLGLFGGVVLAGAILLSSFMEKHAAQVSVTVEPQTKAAIVRVDDTAQARDARRAP